MKRKEPTKETTDEELFFKVSGTGKLKKTKKDEKEDKEEKDLKDEFGKIYANALYDMSTSRSFNDDGGCYYDMLQTEVEKIGDWTRIYQPTRGMKEYEDGIFYYIFKYKEPITEKQFKSFQPIIKKINELYLMSYNDVLKRTGNKWSLTVEKGTFEEVAQIEKNLYLDDKGVIKMSSTIRGYENWTCCDWWDPVRLLCWIKDIEYKENDENYKISDAVLENYKNYESEAVEAKL